MRNGLGKIKSSEMRVLVIFLSTALLWVFRGPINNIPGLEGLTDPGLLCCVALPYS
ncbi:MAG: hypothetical protein Ct9H300mP4_17000 [Gammaproteobacteria bacterium]|nr:MAG: hypothetical protein Ct9H300mP4_17000 [Gammaproteobacteria bacterium]